MLPNKSEMSTHKPTRAKNNLWKDLKQNVLCLATSTAGIVFRGDGMLTNNMTADGGLDWLEGWPCINLDDLKEKEEKNKKFV